VRLTTVSVVLAQANVGKASGILEVGEGRNFGKVARKRPPLNPLHFHEHEPIYRVGVLLHRSVIVIAFEPRDREWRIRLSRPRWNASSSRDYCVKARQTRRLGAEIAPRASPRLDRLKLIRHAFTHCWDTREKRVDESFLVRAPVLGAGRNSEKVGTRDGCLS
jgi:hypothetical protein